MRRPEIIRAQQCESLGVIRVPNQNIMTIDKTYWNTDTEITASFKEKLDIVKYEIKMFLETCKKLEAKSEMPEFEKNLLVESFATHSRLLINFFNPGCTIKRTSDVVCEDFIENWNNIKPEMTQVLFDAKNKADKQLAHISKWRIKIERDGKKGWSPEVARDIKILIKKFKSKLNVPRT